MERGRNADGYAAVVKVEPTKGYVEAWPRLSIERSILSHEHKTQEVSMSILKRGMSGAPVKRLQEKLGIDADGIFGLGTEKAVKAFQEANGLSVDGIAGPDTFMAMGLEELVLLRRGTRGAAVKRLQAGLGIGADGQFGPATEKAVRDFQAANGLDVDGLAGPETLAKLDAFSEITAETVAKAAVKPGEEVFESEPMPEVSGSDVVAGSSVSVPEEKSVWGKVKGWFS
jgi:peptidoglycan hydrolase-like protein with peptidoglycan-binding domain